ncbi:23S rRNA (pseudouridine(1915)-N(3))-methyltransferase RlmH [Candidatus Falkowbacteria bacterium]|nr:23S rRNA (pseudouridine(1915)-N(3))-methyltransferase RlmH [Candidatus Falkowbacteria bacterium]
MLDITIVAIGKIKSEYWREAIVEYEKMLRPYAKITFEEISPEPICIGDKEKTKKKEGEKILRSLAKYPKNEILLLTEKGKEFDSLKFSDLFKERNDQVVFAIGGSLGFSKEVLEAYPQISLSRLTFPHEMARVVLIEQIYRAATIINKKEYHH